MSVLGLIVEKMKEKKKMHRFTLKMSEREKQRTTNCYWCDYKKKKKGFKFDFDFRGVIGDYHKMINE